MTSSTLKSRRVFIYVLMSKYNMHNLQGEPSKNALAILTNRTNPFYGSQYQNRTLRMHRHNVYILTKFEVKMTIGHQFV